MQRMKIWRRTTMTDDITQALKNQTIERKVEKLSDFSRTKRKASAKSSSFVSLAWNIFSSTNGQ